MAELKAQLIADKGGVENVSTAEMMLIDLAVDAYLKKQSVAAFIRTLPSLVDKRHRRTWQVVKDDKELGAHLQSLLRDLGLERRAKEVPTLQSYLAAKAKEGEAGTASPPLPIEEMILPPPNPIGGETIKPSPPKGSGCVE
jgi:hypothetical protein